MESRRWRFALCGSSARKLRRGGADLLAGRAVNIDMEGFSAKELGHDFDLEAALDWGTLPFVVRNRDRKDDVLAAYLNTYLKEEIREEGLVRRVPPFVRFLAVAGQMNGQSVNLRNIARDAGVARSTAETYFSILEDTLVGHFLPAWRPRFKVREAAHPKFYWFDPGVARAAAGWLRDPTDRLWQGIALETLVFHELRVYNEASRKHRPLHYYRTAAGVEADFVIETTKRRPGESAEVVAIEVKRADTWRREFESPLRAIEKTPGIEPKKLIGVYTGTRSYAFGRIEVLPVAGFLERLHGGLIF